MIVANHHYDKTAEQWMMWQTLEDQDVEIGALWSVVEACPHLLRWADMQEALERNP